MKFPNLSIVLAAVALQRQGAVAGRTWYHDGHVSSKSGKSSSKSGKSSEGTWDDWTPGHEYHWSGSLVKLRRYGGGWDDDWYGSTKSGKSSSKSGKSSKGGWNEWTYDDEDDWMPGWRHHHKKYKGHRSKFFVRLMYLCSDDV